MSVEEFFPPTEEELIQMIADLTKQLQDCDDNDEGTRLTYEKMKLERKLKQLKEDQENEQ